MWLKTSIYKVSKGFEIGPYGFKEGESEFESERAREGEREIQGCVCVWSSH